jgi:hypothetical protein
MAKGACQGVVISGSASYGNDPVPLYSAGESKIACVVELEALGQIQVSKATFSNQIGGGGGQAVFGGLTLTDVINKYQLQAQSGQAYYVDTLISTGRVQ